MYDLLFLPAYLVLYTLFQAMGIIGLAFPQVKLTGNAIKFYYLGYRQMFSSQGIVLFQNQQRWDIFNLGRNYDFLGGELVDFGYWHCELHQAIYMSFGWMHDAFYSN